MVSPEKPVSWAFYSLSPLTALSTPASGSACNINAPRRQQNLSLEPKFLPINSASNCKCLKINWLELRTKQLFPSFYRPTNSKEPNRCAGHVFRQYEQNLLGQHINSCSRVIHSRSRPNKIKHFSGFSRDPRAGNSITSRAQRARTSLRKITRRASSFA
jgi:hypothetical protein